jgi:hypothetical protein
MTQRRCAFYTNESENSTVNGLNRIALWQFAAFLMLLLFIWANELLGLSRLIFNTAAQTEDIDYFGCALLSACVILTAIVVVGHSYIQEKDLLQGFVTVCSRCRKVRINQEVWEEVENFVSQRSKVTFSHGLCPTCYQESMAEIDEMPSSAETEGSIADA